jgi:hypothetical protein
MHGMKIKILRVFCPSLEASLLRIPFLSMSAHIMTWQSSDTKKKLKRDSKPQAACNRSVAAAWLHDLPEITYMLGNAFRAKHFWAFALLLYLSVKFENIWRDALKIRILICTVYVLESTCKILATDAQPIMINTQWTSTWIYRTSNACLVDGEIYNTLSLCHVFHKTQFT